MTPERLDEVLRALRPADPPAATRARVLSRATIAIAPPATIVERLWASRAVRLALAASLALGIAGEAWTFGARRPIPPLVAARPAALPRLDVDPVIAARLSEPRPARPVDQTRLEDML